MKISDFSSVINISNDKLENYKYDYSDKKEILADKPKAVSIEAKMPKLNAMDELEGLIGLSNVKTQIKRYAKAFRKDKKAGHPLNLHMVFSGNPGTGKTTVARLLGKILKDAGILKKGHVIEGSRETLVGKYIGHTGPKTRAAIESAMGGILFIDEAYSLNSDDGFCKEAMAELIKGMEDSRGEFCLILAGYTKEMEEMFSLNQGLKSRIQRNVIFDDYSKPELSQILDITLKAKGYTASLEVKAKLVDYVDAKRNNENFSNAREIRIMVEQLAMIQAERTINNFENREITIADMDVFLAENEKKSTDGINWVAPIAADELLRKYDSVKFDSIFDPNLDEALNLVSFGDEFNSNNTLNGVFISANGYFITTTEYLTNAKSISVRRKTKDRFNNVIYATYKASPCKKLGALALFKAHCKGDKIPFMPIYRDNEKIELRDVIQNGYIINENRLVNNVMTRAHITSTQVINDINLFTLDIQPNLNLSGSPIIDSETKGIIGITLAKSYSNKVILALSYYEIWRLLYGR